LRRTKVMLEAELTNRDVVIRRLENELAKIRHVYDIQAKELARYEVEVRWLRQMGQSLSEAIRSHS